MKVALKKSDDLPDIPVTRSKPDDDFKPFRKRIEGDYRNITTGESLGRMSRTEARQLAKDAGWKLSNLKASNENIPLKKEKSITKDIDKTLDMDELSNEQLIWLFKHFQGK